MGEVPVPSWQIISSADFVPHVILPTPGGIQRQAKEVVRFQDSDTVGRYQADASDHSDSQILRSHHDFDHSRGGEQGNLWASEMA